MNPLDLYLGALGDAVPARVGDGRDGLSVDHVEFRLPVEAHIEADGLHLSNPRGRLATGFDPPLGTVRVRFEREDDGE